MMGIDTNDITLKRDAPQDALDILFNQKKFTLMDDIFKPFIMLKEHEYAILDQFIAEQQTYLTNNVEILVENQ